MELIVVLIIGVPMVLAIWLIARDISAHRQIEDRKSNV